MTGVDLPPVTLGLWAIVLVLGLWWLSILVRLLVFDERRDNHA